jgi:hypothetical protein
VVAPTGTIGLVMDCDTTGIEPDFALVKFKKLAGGGYFKIINRAVPEALRVLGYSEAEIAEIEAFITGANEILSYAGPPTIIVVSDHGMTEVVEEFDLLDWLKPWELGVDFLAFLDATMARFWDIRRQPLHEIVARVSKAQKGRFLSDADLSSYGLNFPDKRFGDLIFILKPGCILKPSFMDSPELPFFHHKYRGMHGYEPAHHSSTRAVFLYHGSKDLLFKPRSLLDVVEVLDGLFVE